MKATVCPTITPDHTAVSFGIQLKRVLPFARRLHVDLMDGIFASPRSVRLDEVYWPANIPIDLHIMYRRPAEHIDALLALKPQLVIIHAEAEGNFAAFAARLQRRGIEVGVALLPGTPVATIAPAIQLIQHVLIFSGHLGHFGGTANLQLLTKVPQLRALKPGLEIGWDGGINAANAQQLAAGGIDVLNVGGFIQHAIDPARAYATLESAA